MIGRKGNPSTLREKRRSYWNKHFRKTGVISICQTEHPDNVVYQAAVYDAARKIWKEINKKKRWKHEFNSKNERESVAVSHQE